MHAIVAWRAPPCQRMSPPLDFGGQTTRGQTFLLSGPATNAHWYGSSADSLPVHTGVLTARGFSAMGDLANDSDPALSLTDYEGALRLTYQPSYGQGYTCQPYIDDKLWLQNVSPFSTVTRSRFSSSRYRQVFTPDVHWFQISRRPCDVTDQFKSDTCNWLGSTGCDSIWREQQLWLTLQVNNSLHVHMITLVSARGEGVTVS